MIVRAARLEDAVALGLRLRAADEAEVWATLGVPPVTGVVRSLKNSDEAYTAEVGGEVAAIAGVSRGAGGALTGSLGQVWLLTSPLVEREPKAFMRQSRALLEQFLQSYDRLHSWIDCRYGRALAWGARLGFRFDPPEPFGHSGLPFRHFEVTRRDLPWA